MIIWNGWGTRHRKQGTDCGFSVRFGARRRGVLTWELAHKPKILVGKDTRLSGDMLECALAAGICSTGAQVVLLGVIPTPAVAYLVREYGADAGVVISASHNPFEYNGIKFFNGEGYKLSDSVEEKIEELILDTEGWGIELPIGGDIGHCTRAEHAADDYIKFATGAIDCKRRAAPFSGLLERR